MAQISFGSFGFKINHKNLTFFFFFESTIDYFCGVQTSRGLMDSVLKFSQGLHVFSNIQGKI